MSGATDQTKAAKALADAQPTVDGTGPRAEEAGSGPVPNLSAALVKALAELTTVDTARTAKIPTKGGGEYSYQYADIADVVKLTRPVLAAHGLVALTPVHAHEGMLACTVTIVHQSGERLDLGPFPFPHGRDAQATGSMVTYHRRYALVAALGIAAGDEDDGASAHARPAQEKDEPQAAIQDRAGWTIAALGDDEKAQVRAYVESMGYPTKPAEWTDGQAATILRYVEGMPQNATSAPDPPADGPGADDGTQGAGEQPAATQEPALEPGRDGEDAVCAGCGKPAVRVVDDQGWCRDCEPF